MALSRVQRWARYFHLYVKACSYYGVGPLASAPNAIRVLFRDRFSPTEIFLLGLLDPGLSIEVRQRQISKAELLRMQQKLNPSEALSLTEDKLKFYMHCRATGLQTAQVIGTTWREELAGCAVPSLVTPDDWLHFFEAHAGEDLILKPVHGVHGADVRMIRWDGSLLCEEGHGVELESFLGELRTKKWTDWLLQERVTPHHSLIELSGTDAVQTARVVTIVGESGAVQLPLVYFRIIASGSSTDNFEFGESGNLVATVDPTNGQILKVLGPSGHGYGLKRYPNHPSTARPFEDTQLPFWEDVMQLVTAAAKAFEPLTTIGWDVAITDEGPTLIEGNATWDPLPTVANLRQVAEQLDQLHRL